MPLQTFNFPNHTEEVAYPESSTRIQFGRGYAFVTKPQGPDQVRFTLHFELMQIFVNANGTINRTRSPQINLALLEDFYLAHRMHEKFILPSPRYGNTVVRFAKPFTYKMKPGGFGTCEPFTLELESQP